MDPRPATPEPARQQMSPVEARSRRITPATVFATLGALFLALQAWIFIRWAAAGDAHAVPSAHDNISAPREAAVWAVQAVVVLLAAVYTWIVVRQCRRTGQITFDAALLLGYVLAFWQSPLFNYRALSIVVNRHTVNVATWGEQIPGWHSPPGQPETLLGLSGLGFVALMTWVWIQAWLTIRISRRFPQWGWGRLLPATLAAGFVVDWAIEAVWGSTGFFSYATQPTVLTLFEGHWYGMPLLYYAAVTLFISTGAVVIRHQAQARGTVPYIFRGTELLTGRAPAAVRLLAGIGLANILLLTYFAVTLLISHFLGGPMPSDTPGYMWTP
ncbi:MULTISPECIES: spirocyclase AveC family protein [unclassified Kitasatospora]|uniref:spirocyclase AveC family protein n=1 Tax=unclassified Kitasatospora TaxID=2633591 RepID=UPI00381EB638